jgi:hypothetical protein
MAPFVLGISSRSLRATVLLVVMALLAFAAAAMTQLRGRPGKVMP